MIPVVPQDIGRVLLNLINNAFYAVNEREKLTANSKELTASPYAPTVSISTKKTGNKVEIKVADNGNGISPKVLEKIFQPFFTTKPTGEGTGLGLSLSYDIVKAHGGEIKVETLPAGEAGKENEGLSAESAAAEQAGTEFIIQLPIS
jgi:two-component system, NtrC family, sensor kinase